MKHVVLMLLFAAMVVLNPIAKAQEAEPQLKPKRGLKAELKEQDPLSIVSGKLLAFAVSSEEQVASTPPGKWANVFGFTYFRYTERGTGKQKANINGLISKMAEGVIGQLDNESVEAIKSVAKKQSEIEIRAIQHRNEISRLLFQWREKPGDESRILALAEDNGKLLAELLEQRITVYSQVLARMTAQQREGLTKVRKGEYATTNARRVASMAKTRDAKRELTLLFGKFVTWATSTAEMSEVIDAGRPAVFFGFANLRITNRQGAKPSGSLRRDTSKIMLRTLDDNQRGQLNKLVEDQATLMGEYLDTRGEIARTLNPNDSTNPKIDWAEIRKLCIESEIAEAKLGMLQADRMGIIVRALGESQIDDLRGFVAETNGAAQERPRERRRGGNRSKK